MNKKVLVIPKGIRFINDWNGYSLSNYPFPHILNKTITGCGFTEYCIGNEQNLILVSPRKFLLENKESQHQGELEVYYARNEYDSVVNYEADLNSTPKRSSFSGFSFASLLLTEDEKSRLEEEKRKKVEYLNLYKEGIREYILRCIFKKKPAKILVTYDSFRHVKDVLIEKGILDKFQIVIDEFQAIMGDSRFKPAAEIELLYHLQGIQKVCFVSATPMMDGYLDRLDEFKDLPYLEFDWKTDEPGRVRKPLLNIKFTNRGLSEDLNRIIQYYLRGKYESRTFIDHTTGKPYTIESHEAVIFLNSVTSISRAIRTNNLTLDQCNVLCAKTKENEKLISKAFKDVISKNGLSKLPRGTKTIGSIPKKGEPHKMFTFCTRTVYLGADFYSTNARTFVFSDSNMECLSVDISMDLEQILGRQRLDENPWKNTANLFVRTTLRKLVQSDFNQFIEKKINDTNIVLKNYFSSEDAEYKNVISNKLERDTCYSKYKYDYLSVNRHAGSAPIPVFNNIVLVSEQRAFDMQQLDYADRFTVMNTLIDEEILDTKPEITKFINIFNQTGNTIEKLKILVEFGELDDISDSDMNNLLNLIQPKYRDYYTILGPDRIRANSYQESKLKIELENIINNYDIKDLLKDKIYCEFLVGERYTKAYIKQTLMKLYKEIGYKKTPKAIDLDEYFNIKDVIILSPKRESGFEILSKKI